MYNYQRMVEDLKLIEKLAQMFEIEPFPIYFIGGSACILGKYYERATLDYDFIDIGYPSKLGKVFRYLSDYDILEYESTTIPSTFKDRAIKLQSFNYLDIYIVSREDIIVSKIVRLSQKDIEDIDVLIKDSSKELINELIQDVLGRQDLFQSKKDAFLNNLSTFEERYNV